MSKKPNFGSDVRIGREGKGTQKYTKYNFVATAYENEPELIEINKHHSWFEYGDKRMIRELTRILSHEAIHNIIWWTIEEEYGEYDYLVGKFRKKIKRECPKNWREWYKF